MVRFYFTSEKPFAKQPKETEHLFQNYEVPFEYAFKTINDLLTHDYNFRKFYQITPIYEIDIQEPQFYVMACRHNRYEITNIGGDVYHEINYQKLIPHEHLYAIAKGINQKYFEIDINNKELIYALICRGYKEDLEKIITAWQKGETDIRQDSQIATLFVIHHANKYGDFFLPETKHVGFTHLLDAYAKYGTPEQQDYLLKYREHNHILILTKYATTQLKQKLLNEKSTVIKKEILSNSERNELDLTSLLKSRNRSVLTKLIDKTNNEDFFQLLKNLLSRSFMPKLDDIAMSMLMERCIEIYPELVDNLITKINQTKFKSTLFQVDNNKFRNKLINERPILSTKDKKTLIHFGGYPYAQMFESEISNDIKEYVEECLDKQDEHLQTIKDAKFSIYKTSLNALSNENLNKLMQENIAPFKKEAIQNVIHKRREAGQY